MNILRKAVIILALAGVTAAAPVAAADTSLAVIPGMRSLVAFVSGRAASELTHRLVQAWTSATAAGATHTSVKVVGGNHMIIEAQRLAPDVAPLRGFSGPRRKQSGS